ncbi:metallophosphoesterase family protein [Aquimarina megaterium]|uniref:metallophosphoesterase family protein n=1 Tax=Aquimarina megaterium TaxID=1443666 RepID=UPI00046EA813|nr:metallophosphoesterase [Aquimarina megaterium]
MKRILWLSDIHLNGESENNDTKNLLTAFQRKLKSIGNIDYLVISGDIANTGDNDKHYKLFSKKIIAPIKDAFSEIKIISVPGNHDVHWGQAKKEIQNFLMKGGRMQENKLQEFKEKTINSNYYDSVFMKYNKFHNNFHNNISNTPSDTFSNNYSDDNDNTIVFTNLNSAWLSIGVSAMEGDNNFRKVQNTYSNTIYADKDKTQLIFEEVGNQSYGFTLSNINKDISKLENELISEYKDSFKILVAHHPPNNWLSWEELYNSSINDKSEFNKFINKTDIDLMLVGHEHTSLVEGELIFGKTLVLKAGMFLDHHEKDHDLSWFKILEIEEQEKIVREKWYNYHPAGPFWKEAQEYGMEYKNWKSISSPIIKANNRINDSEHKVSKADSSNILISDDDELKSKINSAKSWKKEALFKLVGFPENLEFHTIKKGLLLYSYKKEEKTPILFVIDNIEDVFSNNPDDLPKNSYIEALLAYLKENNSHSDIFIFYMYSFANKEDKESQKYLKRIIRKKFEHFKYIIFNNDLCKSKLKNAKFAIRMV